VPRFADSVSVNLLEPVFRGETPPVRVAVIRCCAARETEAQTIGLPCQASVTERRTSTPAHCRLRSASPAGR